jgi:hypothetical protein
MKGSRLITFIVPLAVLLCSVPGEGAADADAAGEGVAPAYTPDGALQVPAAYREWIYLSSGLDMSYSPLAMGMQSVFDNVFVNPESWTAFKKTGHWPDKTVFVLEIRRATSHGSINKHGSFQTAEVTGLEFHVRDEARFKGGWGFFESDGKQAARHLAETESCYECHRKNGAVDTTFVQFYPTAKPIAVAAGTYHEAAEPK